MKILFLSLSCLLILVGCGGDGESKLLSWEDSGSGNRFEIVTRSTIAKTNNYFLVGNKEALIDDDAIFSNPRFLKIDNWLLVMNESEVWAGYDYSSNHLFGEGEWDKLPFTVHSSGGRIVAEKRLHPKNEANRPLRWPQIQQQANTSEMATPMGASD